MNLFSITRTIPEFNRVVDAPLKGKSKILSHSGKLDLIRIS